MVQNALRATYGQVVAEDVEGQAVVGLGRGDLVQLLEGPRADLRVQDDHGGVRVRPGELVVALVEVRLWPGGDRRVGSEEGVGSCGGSSSGGKSVCLATGRLPVRSPGSSPS